MYDDVLDWKVVVGKRIVQMRLHRNVTIRENNDCGDGIGAPGLGEAVDAMERFVRKEAAEAGA